MEPLRRPRRKRQWRLARCLCTATWAGVSSLDRTVQFSSSIGSIRQRRQNGTPSGCEWRPYASRDATRRLPFWPRNGPQTHVRALLAAERACSWALLAASAWEQAGFESFEELRPTSANFPDLRPGSVESSHARNQLALSPCGTVAAGGWLHRPLRRAPLRAAASPNTSASRGPTTRPWGAKEGEAPPTGSSLARAIEHALNTPRGARRRC